MNKSNLKFSNINQYHSNFPKEIQKQLRQLRQAIQQAAPQATEIISYGMPAFKQNKVLVYYAANKSHIGFYPTPRPIVIYKKELEKYKTSKGAIQFPTDKPLPLSLIKKIVKYRLTEDIHNFKPAVLKKPSTILIPANKDILNYYKQFSLPHQAVCKLLSETINSSLPTAENKIWHAHPVWFINDNPIVGYSKQKPGIRLMFWSGADFEEAGLNIVGGKFKDASVFYNNPSEVLLKDLKRWLKKSKTIQWDYKNIIKRKGRLERVKTLAVRSI